MSPCPYLLHMKPAYYKPKITLTSIFILNIINMQSLCKPGSLSYWLSSFTIIFIFHNCYKNHQNNIIITITTIIIIVIAATTMVMIIFIMIITISPLLQFPLNIILLLSVLNYIRNFPEAKTRGFSVFYTFQ